MISFIRNLLAAPKCPTHNIAMEYCDELDPFRAGRRERMCPVCLGNSLETARAMIMDRMEPSKW